MASEIRVNSITNRSGLTTTTWNDQGIVLTGIVTATKLSGPFDSLTSGSINVSGDATISGNLGVAGTITYEDVARVDATGISTFREGLNIGPLAGIAATVYKDGSIRSTGIVTATSFSGSGANLTSIPAGQLTGALPAISGASLTGIDATSIKDSGGNVKVQANTHGVVVTGVATVGGEGAYISNVSVGIGTTTTTGRNAGVNTAFGAVTFDTDLRAGYIYSSDGWKTFSNSKDMGFANTGYYESQTAATADSLLSFWNCDAASVTKTLSDGSQTAVHYTITSTSGKVGNAWDRGTAADNGFKLSNSPTGANMTIAFWFNMTDNTIHSSSDGGVILQLSSATNEAGKCILGVDGSNASVLRAGGNNWVSGGTQIATISENNWYHYAVTQNGTGGSAQWKHYFNGSLEHTATETIENNGTWWFSNYSRHGGNTNNHYMRGKFDELAVWTRTLSATEITNVYNNVNTDSNSLYNP